MKYPKCEEGCAQVRDQHGNFLKMFPREDLSEELIKGQWKSDFEVMLFEGSHWIPLDDLACQSADKERADAAFSRAAPQEVLLQACAAGDYELIKWALIEDGVKVNAQDCEALYLALTHNHEKCVRLLINRGAEVSMRHVQAAVASGNDRIAAAMNPRKEARLTKLFQQGFQALEQERSSRRQLEANQAQVKVLQGQLAAIREISVKDAAHIPKCPTCGSTTVTRIPPAAKGIASVLFGFFSIGFASKSFKCLNCEYTW